jgi:MoaA/NifB/PqqE/SkfB family radical SAM enzyme
MRHSLYWDDFEQRAIETEVHVRNETAVPIRRVAIFITEGCNFRCKYCNLHSNSRVKQSPTTLSQGRFEEVVEKYGKTAIIHITGGEPSIVPWLYPYLMEHGHKYRFHLNTNAYIMPPSPVLRRLKVSLDSCQRDYWDELVGRVAFDRVVDNIKQASKQTVTTVTYTVTGENYSQILPFILFAARELPDLYAIFFSIYKSENPRYTFTRDDIDNFFDHIIPAMKQLLNAESVALLNETMSEKQRLVAGVRFPENDLLEPCYLSMSERVIAPDGSEYACSHLYRDGIHCTTGAKHTKCLYGCNQRLVDFNRIVSDNLNRS